MAELLRRLLRTPQGLLGVLIVGLILVIVVCGPWLAPYGPDTMAPRLRYRAPGTEFLLGTDQYGRDILSRAITGARLSLLTGLGAVVVALTAGVVVGLACGVIGGWTDLLVMRVVDIMMAFPGILMALVVVAVLGQGTLNVMLAVGVSLIPTFVRLVRGDVLSVRENQYVEAARALGCWPARVALRHVLPNVVAPIIVISTVAIAWSIILGASLSFLGLGPRPPIPEWGIDLSGGRNYLLRAWWISSVPGFCIMLTVVAVNLVGDALRDELDPRVRSLANL
jgi:peptide/nickel transport system permease protein